MNQVEFDIYWEPTDSHLYLLLPYGEITVSMLKEKTYKYFHPDNALIEGKYLN